MLADLLATGTGSIDVNLHAPALLPTTYCGDVHTRLSFYKRFASAERDTEIDVLLEELADRFGKPPPAAQTLIDTHRLRVMAQPLGVQKISDAAPRTAIISFKPNPPIDPMAILNLVQRQKHIKLAGNDKLRIDRELARGA